jgi:hypothetical protein
MRTDPLRLVLLLMLGCGSSGATAGGSATTAPPPPAPPPAPPPSAMPAPAEAAGSCTAIAWKAGDSPSTEEVSFEGKLDVIAASVPNGAIEHPYIVFLAKAVCLPAGTDPKATDSIHVFSSDTGLQAQLQALKGKRVVVTGEGFVWQTAHHHRPIVLEIKRITAK